MFQRKPVKHLNQTQLNLLLKHRLKNRTLPIVVLTAPTMVEETTTVVEIAVEVEIVDGDVVVSCRTDLLLNM